MADISDIEDAIVTEVIAALYPSGSAQPSCVGATCRIYRGWPSPSSLNSDLAAGVVNVTIFPSSSPGEVLNVYLDSSLTTAPPSALAATVTGKSVTFSGQVITGEIVGLLVDDIPYIFTLNSSDTTENIAAGVATLICRNQLALSNGCTVTVPGAVTLTSRVVANGVEERSVRRQRREIQVNCWCPSAALRDLVGTTIDAAFSTSSFIDVSDGTKAHVRYVATQVYDQSQNALLYRRDLCYDFEYFSISSVAAPVMLFGKLVRNYSKTYL
jgi:hypothetical protein